MIVKLRLVNWRSYTETTWEPTAGVNLVIAPNDSGKTSLRAAIEYVLAGRASDITDERGGGAEALIRGGERQAVIEAVLASGDGEPFGVRRTVYSSSTQTKVEVQGVAGNTTVQEDALRKRLGHGPDVVSLALNAGRFLARPVAEQQGVILRLAGAGWTAEQIAAAMGSPRSVRALALVDCAQTAGGAEALAAIEKRAKEARPIAKRDLAAVAADLQRLPTGRVLSEAAKAETTGRLTTLQAQRDGLQREAGAAALRSSTQARLRGQRERLRQELDALEGAIAKYQAGPTVEAAAKAEAEAKAVAGRDAAAATKLKVETAAVLEDMANWSAAIEALTDGEDGHCPFCPELRCGIQVEQAHAAMTAGLQAAELLGAGLSTQAVTAQDAAASSAAAAQGASEAHIRAQGRRDALAVALRDQQRKREALDEVETAIQTGTQAVHGDAALEERVADLDRQIEADRGLLAASDRAAEAAEHRGVLEAELAECETKLADIEDLCAEFGPDGIRRRLLRPTLDGFLQDANFVLNAAAGGASCQFATDGAIEVSSPQWSGRLRAGGLGRSLRLRVGIALQYALCRAADWRLLLVDDADMLDASNRNGTVDLLLDAASEGRQVIVLAAQPQTPLPCDPGIERLALWTIDGGQFRRLGPAPATAGVA